jgi:heme-degrading monooxygenase HmoA
VWGEVAALAGLPVTHVVAAAGALVAIPLTWRWKLQTGPSVDLSPSMHWPAPLAPDGVENDQGPVMVTVEYRVAAGDRDAFLSAIDRLGIARRRDGAYAWEVLEDMADAGRFLETFFIDSWLDHLHQHQRVTNADRDIQARVDRFNRDGIPKVTRHPPHRGEACPMIVELVEMDVTPGGEAAFETAFGPAIELIKRSKGCLSARLLHGIENPSRFRVVVEWETLEDHTEGFRGSPGHLKFKEIIAPFVVRSGGAEHHTVALHT